MEWMVSLGLFDFGRAYLISSQAGWMLSQWKQQLARPDRQTSSPLSLDPLKPKQNPMLFLSLERRQLDPTSVKKPNLAQGIANIEFSVAIMKGEKAETPNPPPMTIPSQLAICKAGNCEILQSRLNSSLKKLSLSSGFASLSNNAFTSPPAQKAFPPAPYIQKALFFPIDSRFAFRSRIICKFSELRALGLLSTTFRKESFSTKSILFTVRVVENLAWLRHQAMVLDCANLSMRIIID